MNSQRPRDDFGIRRRTLPLKAGLHWDTKDGVHEASSDPVLEAALRPFLAELTIPQRDALRLVFWERLTLREAAVKEGVAVNAIVERLERAKAAIKKALAAAGAGDTYEDVRGWIKPSEDAQGFVEAHCTRGGEVLAKYRANALGHEPSLSCAQHME